MILLDTDHLSILVSRNSINKLPEVALYVTAWTALASWTSANWLRAAAWSRLLWTAGCLANLAHAVIAFHFVYAWDHESAYAAVAAQTYEQTGLDSGNGLYINYAFSTLWLIDAVIWWLVPQHYERRPRWLDGIVQFVFLFMFVNATVVFGKSTSRFVGAVLCPAGMIGWLRTRRPSRVALMSR